MTTAAAVSVIYAYSPGVAGKFLDRAWPYVRREAGEANEMRFRRDDVKIMRQRAARWSATMRRWALAAACVIFIRACRWPLPSSSAASVVKRSHDGAASPSGDVEGRQLGD